jgi:hypothetical protein
MTFKFRSEFNFIHRKISWRSENRRARLVNTVIRTVLLAAREKLTVSKQVDRKGWRILTGAE